MFRDIPYVIATFILAISLMMGLGYYYQTSFKQDSITLNINDAVRSSVITNVDNKTRINEGELFIVKEEFESMAKEKIKSLNNSLISEEATYQFEYLDNDNGSIKAVRVVVNDGETTYQGTARVDITEE